MDKELLDDLINQVKEDKARINDYKGIESLIEMFSDEDLEYFFEGCGEDLFTNISLSYKFIELKPLQLKKYIDDFINKFVNLVNERIEKIKELYSNGQMSQIDMQHNIDECEISKKHLLKFQVIYGIEINNVLNNKK